LAPDVIKNTGLKIMHRTVASDDRQVMGGAMNLNDAQLRQVVALGTGEAVVHGGGKFGDDNAILVRIPEIREQAHSQAEEAGIRKNWEKFIAENSLAEKFAPYPTCGQFCHPINNRCAEAQRIAEDPLVAQSFASFILTLVAGSFSKDVSGLLDLAQALYPGLDGVIHSHIIGSRADAFQQHCILTHGFYRFMESRGRQYGWTYSQMLRRIQELLPALAELAANTSLGSASRNALDTFCREYSGMCQLKYEPFIGCQYACGRSPICLFRYAMEPLISDEVLDSIFTNVGPGEGEALASACELAAGRAILFIDPDASSGVQLDETVTKNAAFCYLIQKVNANPANWPPQNRQAVIELLRAWYGEAYHPVGIK
jgi:hypothetical protein